MDAKTRKHLRVSFDRLIADRLPEFEKVNCEDLMPGERVYRTRLDSGVNCFLFVLEIPKDNDFTLEAAISQSEIFPAYCGLMNPREITMPDGTTHPADRVSKGQFRSRAGAFLDVYEDLWWKVDPANVEGVAESAVSYFKGTMLPRVKMLASQGS